MAIGLGTALVGVGAGLAIGLSAIGAGIGVGISGAAASAVSAENPEKFGMALVFSAIPQTQAIYGLLVGILLLLSTGILAGSAIDVPISIGLVAIGCGFAVGFAGLSAIGQGIAASAGNDSMFGRGIVFSAICETQAIYGLLVAVLLMALTGILSGNFSGSVAVGLAAIGGGFAVGLAGFSAIGQGITSAAGIAATSRYPEAMGRSLVFAAMSETFAIFGLLIALLIMFGIGLFG
jgi:F0F1-type ATP synthase membrane subunit c/vacuolar-type H+-ATPase subunit K